MRTTSPTIGPEGVMVECVFTVGLSSLASKLPFVTNMESCWSGVKNETTNLLQGSTRVW